jgi:hypothetical protein
MTNPTPTPQPADADQAKGPSLADVAELCAEFEYHIDSDDYHSIGILRDMITAAITRWRAPVAQSPVQPVNLAELHDLDFSDGLTPSQHLDVLHGGADARVAAAPAPQPRERLSTGKLVSDRIQELLDEVAQRGLEPSSVILGIRAEELLRKEVRKSLLFQRNANQDNPLPLPNVHDQLFVYGVQVNKSDVEAAEYVGIEVEQMTAEQFDAVQLLALKHGISWAETKERLERQDHHRTNP